MTLALICARVTVVLLALLALAYELSLFDAGVDTWGT